MTKLKERKALTRWENDTREWAHQTARNLVLAIVRGQPVPANPYRVGVVLDPGERVWAECPIRFLQEMVPRDGPAAPPVRPWLVTSDRIVGRLGDDHLYGWRWDHVRGCRVDLRATAEFVVLDMEGGCQLEWTGPGVAPLAVATVFRLQGRTALVQHPGLHTLRLRSPEKVERPIPPELPTRCLGPSGLRIE